MRRIGERQWSVRFGEAQDLAVLLAVRELADLPVYDAAIPEPLDPAPSIDQLLVGQQERRVAAPQWAALWRIVLAAHTALGREANVVPSPPLYGLAPIWSPDPPSFASLEATPELKQVVVSTWPAALAWSNMTQNDQPPGNWALDLITAADQAKGAPIADVEVQLETLPIRGTRHWILTEDRQRRRVHALVSADLLTEPERHFDWLTESLLHVG